MTTYNLLHEMQRIELNTSTTDPHTPKIDYQSYEITVDGVQSQTVLIPIRECDKFEHEVENSEQLNCDDVRKLMRKYRGIVQKEES